MGTLDMSECVFYLVDVMHVTLTHVGTHCLSYYLDTRLTTTWYCLHSAYSKHTVKTLIELVRPAIYVNDMLCFEIH